MGPEPPFTGARLDRAVGLRHKAPGSTLILIGLGGVSLLLYLSFALATKGTSPAVPFFPLRKGIIPGFLTHFYLLFALYLGSVWSVFRGRAHGGGGANTLN